MCKTSFSLSLTRLKNIFWPIENKELKKFLPMGSMLFCILFNYTAFRAIKDGFIVTSVGPEAIGFLKTYAVLPSAIVMTILYTKLCNIMNQQRVFYTITSSFLLYITCFALILYPNADFFHPDPDKIHLLSTQYPSFKWFIRIVGCWSYASFYIVAELWGNMILGLLFWQFATQITSISEAKRFYPMLGLIGNCSLLGVALVIGLLLNNKIQLIPEHLRFIPILLITIANGVVILFLYNNLNTRIFLDNSLEKQVIKNKIVTPKLGVKDSIKMIFTSKYLGLLAILVIAYGVSINLVEGVWKSKIRDMYPTKEKYTLFMSVFQAYQGIAAIIFMLIGSNILRNVSWRTAAILTPIMMGITGIIFFIFIFLDNISITGVTIFTGSGSLFIAIIIGSIQNILTKATKYSLFDSTKEMVYMTVDNELRTKGKAAVDVVASRGGKSIGGIVQSTFFILLPNTTFSDASPFFAILFFITLLLWILAIKTLNKKMQNY